MRPGDQASTYAPACSVFSRLLLVPFLSPETSFLPIFLSASATITIARRYNRDQSSLFSYRCANARAQVSWFDIVNKIPGGGIPRRFHNSPDRPTRWLGAP